MMAPATATFLYTITSSLILFLGLAAAIPAPLHNRQTRQSSGNGTNSNGESLHIAYTAAVRNYMDKHYKPTDQTRVLAAVCNTLTVYQQVINNTFFNDSTVTLLREVAQEGYDWAKSLCGVADHSVDFIFTLTPPGICTSDSLDSFEKFSDYCTNILLLTQAYETLKESLLPVGTAYPAANLSPTNRCEWLSEIGISEC